VSDALIALDKDSRCVYMNEKAGVLLQRRPEELNGKNLWSELPETVGQPFHDACQRALAGQSVIEVEEFHPAYQQWLEYRICPTAQGLTIFFHDISDRKQAESLINGQNQILEMIAAGMPLAKTLEALLHFLDRQSQDTLCSLLLLDADGLHFRSSIAPSLPDAYSRAFDGLPIGEGVGSCGTAAYRREPVIVEDIANDPLWLQYRELALSHGLRACWSIPIFNAAHRVLGTFAIYYRQPGKPVERHLRIMAIATHLAAIAISHAQDEEALRSSARRYRSTLDSILEGCQLIGNDWRYLYLNHAAAQHNHRPNEELLGRTMMEAWPGIETTAVFALIKRCMQEQIALQEEIEFVFPAGSKGWFDVRTRPVSEGIFVLSIDISERKRADMALLEKEERLRLALDAAKVGTYDWDIPGDRITWSRWHEEIWGYPPGGFDGSFAAFSERVHADDLPAINAEITRCIAKREPYAQEFRIVWPDASVHWIQADGEFSVDDAGRPVRMLGAVLEITARKQASLQLARSERHLRAIIDNEPECVKLLGADGSLLEMNPAGLRMLEADTFEQLRDHGIYPVVVEQYRPAFKSLIATVFAGGAGELEFEIIGLKGKRRWMTTHASPIRDDTGQVYALLGISRDITEQRKAENALRESEAQYRLLFAQNPNPMWVYDIQTLTYLDVNEAAIGHYGYSREEFLAMTVRDIRPPEDVPRLIDTIASLPDQRIWMGEWCHLKKDKTLIDVDVYTNSITFAGRAARIGTSIDISERKQTERALRSSRELLDESQSIAKLGGWEINIPSQTLTWTAETYRIHETTPEQFSPSVATGADYYLPESRRIITEAMQAAIEHGNGYDLELEKLTLLGRRIDVRTTCQVTWRDGRPAKLTGIIQDITERKRTELGLRESNERFQLVTRATNDVVRDWSVANNVMWWNESFTTAFGYSSSAVETGIESWINRLHPDDAVRVKARFYQAIADHDSDWTEEYRFRCCDGSYVEILDRGYILYDGDDTAVRMIGAMMDISERKRAERALVESRQQLSMIIDNVREGLIISTQDGTQLSMNPAGQLMHGLSKEEIASHSLLDFGNIFEVATLEGTVLPVSEWPLSRVLRGQPVDNLELQVRRIGSDWERIFSYTGALATYADDKVQALLATHDITERKHAEAFHLAVTGAEIGTWHWNLVTGELRWSERCKAIFGIPVDAPMSYARFIESLHPDDRERIELAVQTALIERSTYQVEMRNVWPDGSVHWATSKGQVVYDSDGKPLRMEGAAIDISASKQAEAEMLLLNEQLEASNHELQAFSYSVSHDLRAPLRGIDGWSLALLEDYGDRLDDQGRQFLQRVRSETQHMGRLIDSLLQLSRVTQSEMHEAPVNLSDIAGSIVRALHEAAPQRIVEVSVQTDLWTRGDAGLLRAALTNLLDNAWKFSQLRSPARIAFGCVVEDGVARYFVRDNGAGFDMAQASKLFSPFQRMHRQSDFPGTGIGLAIVQRIISRHGGKIWAESVRELGTTFHFTLGGDK